MKYGFSSGTRSHAWGGSEVLWSQLAMTLLKKGHDVTVDYPQFEELPGPLREICELGGSLAWASPTQYSWPQRIARKTKKVFARVLPDRATNLVRRFTKLERRLTKQLRLRQWLLAEKPDVVLITLGSHDVDEEFPAICREHHVPYVLILQAAHRNRWIGERKLENFRQAYAGAIRCYFVSQENQEIMEAQLGATIPQARIIDNPVDLVVNDPLPWPQGQDAWRLASVGRIHFQSKGQDLILQALRSDKWKTRNLHVTFWGQDQGNLRQLTDLVDLYGLKDQVSVGGYVDNMLDVWSTHHGLVLGSRYEGNVLAGLEAQVCGRVPIVTKVGRNGELIDDNVTGFLAAAPTAELIDDALERAWQRRHEWKSIGQLAAQRVRKLCDMNPCQTVHRDLESLTRDLGLETNGEFVGQLLGNAA